MQFSRFLVHSRNFWRNYKLLVLMFGLLGLLALTFWIGFLMTHRSSDDVWGLIPTDAVVIAEVPDLPSSWDKLRKHPLWQPFEQMPYFKNAARRAGNWGHFTQTTKDSLGDAALPEFLFKSPPKVYASWHLTSPKDAAWLMYLSLNSELEKSTFQQFIKNYAAQNSLQLAERRFNGRVIYEVRPERSAEFLFGFIWEEETWIGSVEPLLLDQVVRHVENFSGTPLSPPKQKNQAVIEADTDLKLHLPFQNLDRATAALFETSTLPLAEHFAESLELSFTLKKDRLLATGITGLKSKGENQDYTALLNKSPMLSNEIYRFVPWQTALLLRQSWGNTEEFRERWENFQELHAPERIVEWENWEDDYSFRAGNFIETLGEEMTFATLEKPARRLAPKLLILPLKDSEKAEELLMQFAQNTLPPKTKTPYVTKHERWRIQRLNVEEFPQKMFGETFKGFEQTYFIFLRKEKYLLLANSTQTLKNLYDDWVAERTWAQQIRQRQFWEKLEEDAGLSVVVNFSRVWQSLTENLKPTWRKPFIEHPSAWLQTDFAALQFVPTKRKLGAGVVLTFSPKSGAELPQEKITATAEGTPLEEPAQRTVFVEKITSKPYLVQNHIDRSWETLVQDKNNALHLISRDGKILWSKELDAPLVAESVEQIDFYNNGKLQYAFATPKQIYVVDRLGRTLKNFPVTLPEKTQIQFLSIIDYENDKDYRFLASDQNGRLYLYDKNGKGLVGWQPRSLSSRLSAPAQHVRIGEKDLFLALESSGNLSVLQRNGRFYDPFPLRMETPLRSPYLAFKANRLADTEIVTLSALGELIRFNLAGELIGRKTLPREGEMRFSFVPDRVRGDVWLSVRREKDGFTVFDEKNEQRFRVGYPKNVSRLQFQYYRFRTGRTWLVVFDPVAEQITIYRADEGTSMLKKPLKSQSLIGLLYSEAKQELLLYRSYQNRVEKLRISEF